jgi:leucyl aminopeptidase
VGFGTHRIGGMFELHIEPAIASLPRPGPSADLNLGYTTSAGAIYAALFLEKFVEPGTAWIHLDTFGWNMKARPGRPQGGESRNLFALFHMLEQRYRLEE